MTGRRRFGVRADGRRAWVGRPALLALGWAMSCVLITAVTLTAVERVGREVSGSQDLLTAQKITKQVAAQAASASSASSAAPLPVSSPLVGQPSPSHPATPRASNHTVPVKPSVSVSVAKPAAPSPTPVSSPSPTKPATPPGTEYVFTCRDGKAVGGEVLPTPTPTPSPTPSVSVSVSVSITPTPTPTATTSPTPTPITSSGAPTTSPSPSKSSTDPPIGNSIAEPGGQIFIACAGNTIASASATVTDSAYTLTVRSTSGPRVDVFFSKVSR